MPRKDLSCVGLLFVLLVVLSGCQRETPVENAQSPQPASVADRAAQQAVDAIKTPMDKARGVEGTLEKAAERSAETVKEGGQ
jgi:hypothetical protein